MSLTELTISPDLMIRSVSAADVDSLLDLYRQCEDFLALGPEPKASREMVLSDLEHSASTSGNYCGIYQDGQLVGVIDWIALREPSGTAFIILLMIASGYRGQGLGGRSLEAIEKRVAADPAVWAIETAAQVNNEPGLGFWRRQGYDVISGPIRNADGTTVFHLRKPIRA